MLSRMRWPPPAWAATENPCALHHFVVSFVSLCCYGMSMSFLADKKREHEQAGEVALAAGDFRTAYFHIAKAAEFGFALAEQAGGKIGLRYIEDANELLDIAEKVKQRAQQPATPVQRESVEEEKSTASTWRLKERPTQRLDDVAGLEDVKTELREKVIAPFQHPEVYERFKVEIGGGILMYGPPGNGKTFIARAIAGELDAAFFNVNTSQLKDKYVGETEKNITRLFEEARAHERAIIFLDEVDHLLARRGNQKVGMVAQFLTMMDGLVKNTNCLLVLGATNKPWVIDEAVLRPGRMGTHIYVGPPDTTAREAILNYNLSGVPVADEVSLDNVASRTEGFSGADMTALSDRAKRFALNRQLATSVDTEIQADDFEGALKKIRPSITPAMLVEYLAWRNRQDSGSGSAADLDMDE